ANCPHSRGTASRAKTIEPSVSRSSVGANAALQIPARGGWLNEDNGGGERSASGSSRRVTNSTRTSEGWIPLSCAATRRRNRSPRGTSGAISARGRLVQALGVVEQHAAHVELRDDGHHGPLAPPDPLRRITFLAHVVIQ